MVLYRYLSNPRTYNGPFDKPLITLDGSSSEVGSIVDQVVKNLWRSNGKILSPSQRK